MVVNRLFYLLGYAHARDTVNIDKRHFMDNQKRIVNDGTYTTKRMHELFGQTQSRRINDDMTTQQVLLYVNKIWKPYALCIRSYWGELCTIEQLFDYDALIKRKKERNIYVSHRWNEHTEG